jgi:uncharacterized membrane protein YfcA
VTDQAGPRVAAAPAAVDQPAATSPTTSRIDALGARFGLDHRATLLGLTLPVVCFMAIAITLALAPVAERPTLALGSLIALAAGLAASSVGVFGGVLVPGLLLLGVDARFTAAITLFLQVLVIPVAVGSHFRIGNFSRRVAVPLLIGGVVGAFIGPLVAALLPKELIARLIAFLIIVVGAMALAVQGLKGFGTVRETHEVPSARVAGIGLTAGFSSGLSGAGWGPIGMTLLILSRIDPRHAVGSSLFARVFMAASAVIAYVLAQTALQNVTPDWWLVVPLLAGSLAPMIPGAMLVARLGRTRASVLVEVASILLSIPTLIWGH